MSLIGEQSTGDQYLSFLVDSEEYAIDILRVQEVRGWVPLTRLPNSPPFIKGVLNLRGAIVPIVDLRERFGFPQVEYGPTTVVVVVKVNSADRERVMGLVVDAVYETYYIESKNIRPAPNVGTAVDREFIGGLATIEERMVVLLDIDHLLNDGELAIAAKSGESSKNANEAAR